jgi:hypothetical protein
MAVVMVATLLVMACSAGATIIGRGSFAEDFALLRSLTPRTSDRRSAP